MNLKTNVQKNAQNWFAQEKTSESSDCVKIALECAFLEGGGRKDVSELLAQFY